MTHEHEHTGLLPAMALGALAPDEREQVGAHLARCDACRSQLSDYEAVVDRLGLGAPLVSPPDALQARLMGRIQAPVRARVHWPFDWFSRLVAGWPRLVPAGVLAGLALAAILTFANLYVWRQMSAPGQSGPENVNLIHLRATEAAPGASGTLLLAKDGAWGMLVVHGLPALDAERQYQLWLIDDGRRSSGGVFSVSAQGEAQLKVLPVQRMESYEAFGITIEPRGGSSGPTGAKVLGGVVTGQRG